MIETKSWVNHIIIAIGIIIGIWIIVGFVFQLRYFLGLDVSEQSIPCENCLTQTDNNYQQTIAASSVFILELPSKIYSEDNVVITQDPSDSVKSLGVIKPHHRGNWALQFQALQPGYVDIFIKSNQEAVADYHSIVVIE